MSYNSIPALYDWAINLISISPYKNRSLKPQLTAPITKQFRFYGLFKQINSKGKFPNKPRNVSDQLSVKKWEAWKEYINHDITECQLIYLSLLYPILQHWTSYPQSVLQNYLFPDFINDETRTINLISQIKELKDLIEFNDDVMAKVFNIDKTDETYFDQEDSSSEFSFEELIEHEERPTFGRIDSISTISGFSQMSGPSFEHHSHHSSYERSITSPISENPISQRRSSVSSTKSVELLPTVPYTPSVGASTRRTRQPSLSSITPLCLTSPVKQTPSRSRSNSQSCKSPKSKSSTKSITRSNSHSSDKSRTRTATGPPPPSGLTDETSALIQSTSQRLGQGMVLVRRSLQRLQKLEEKVEGAMHKKSQSPALAPVIISPPTHYLPMPPPKSLEKDSLNESSLSGWFSKVCNTLI